MVKLYLKGLGFRVPFKGFMVWGPFKRGLGLGFRVPLKGIKGFRA